MRHGTFYPPQPATPILPIHTTHQTMETQTKVYHCQACGRGFKTINTFNLHQKVHFPRFRCTVCYKMFTRNYLLEDHMRIHTGARPFQCLICGNWFRTKSSLRGHKKSHEAKGEKLPELLTKFLAPVKPSRPASSPGLHRPTPFRPAALPLPPLQPPPQQPASPPNLVPAPQKFQLHRPWL